MRTNLRYSRGTIESQASNVGLALVYVLLRRQLGWLTSVSHRALNPPFAAQCVEFGCGRWDEIPPPSRARGSLGQKRVPHSLAAWTGIDLCELKQGARVWRRSHKSECVSVKKRLSITHSSCGFTFAYCLIKNSSLMPQRGEQIKRRPMRVDARAEARGKQEASIIESLVELTLATRK
ncbi:hypothetical protein DMENIID0001_160370 [Sergentomyia squamirostris]